MFKIVHVGHESLVMEKEPCLIAMQPL